MDKFSARVHVLMASKARRAVVIRRGPSKHVATIGWNLVNDSFTSGQWLKGRIYERRSDLSPDGKHLIYFAMNGKWESETKGSWTAISRAPYLKAIGLWAKGDCWHGGGLFTSDRRYWINDGYGHQELLAPPSLTREWNQPAGCLGGECFGVYFPRLLRDGWKLVSGPDETDETQSVWVFEKYARGGWTLRKNVHATADHPPGKGCYFDTHQLRTANGGECIDLPSWEWAETHQDRLLWSESGKLFAARLEPGGLNEVRELYDLNPLNFEAVEAPY